MLPPELRRNIEEIADQRGCSAEELVERWVERSQSSHQDREDSDLTAHHLLESIREGVCLLGPDDRCLEGIPQSHRRAYLHSIEEAVEDGP